MPLLDAHGRSARYLRVSLTDACNYRCGFCFPRDNNNDGDNDGGGAIPAGHRPGAGGLLRLCGIFASLGVDRFKVTGGEPFLHPEAIAFMAGLKSTAGVGSLTVTTNGSTLDRHAEELAAIGIDGVNVSVNAMTQAGYVRVTGTAGSLQRVLDNIVLAQDAGLRVKLNMVPLRDVNAADIVPLLDFALPRGLPVRFIELMPLGPAQDYAGLKLDDIMAIIERHFGPACASTESRGNGPAVYLSLPGFPAAVGIIAPWSRRFCAACDRLRLDCAGVLRTCLHHGHGAELSPLLRQGLPDAAIADRIRDVVAEKPDGHHFGDSGAPDVAMRRIGG